MSKWILLLSAALALGASGNAFAIADFQDGTTQGWTQGLGVSAPPAPVLVMDIGPAGVGDDSIEISPASNGNLFPHNNDPTGEFRGDYLSDGVTQVEFDAMAPATNLSANVELHAVVLGGQFERWVSAQAALIPGDGQWRHFTLSLAEVNMAHPLGSNLYGSDFAAVVQFGLRHQTNLGAGGTPLASTNDSVFLDNITLPEPGSTAAAGSVLLALGALARRRRR